MTERSRGTTAKERSDLERLTRDRERVAKTKAQQRAAELKAEVEETLARKFEEDDARWETILRQAMEVIDQAQTSVNDQVAAICAEAGVPKEFHPKLVVGKLWLRRGENADKARRSELRMAAYARIEALRQAANFAIEEQSVEMRTKILATGLYSEEAQALLAQMPQPRELMPSLDLDELEGSVGIKAKALRLDESLEALSYYSRDDHER